MTFPPNSAYTGTVRQSGPSESVHIIVDDLRVPLQSATHLHRCVALGKASLSAAVYRAQVSSSTRSTFWPMTLAISTSL